MNKKHIFLITAIVILLAICPDATITNVVFPRLVNSINYRSVGVDNTRLLATGKLDHDGNNISKNSDNEERGALSSSAQLAFIKKMWPYSTNKRDDEVGEGGEIGCVN
ncbi:RxLR effector protein [Phytophthora megakarya]|uniref:RxLR effector protein n=1 Tax=Phytophthora megakarya TaxID=4795 RepID=A0A225VET1_9STRA|nr:RxLR effector protein [Phytophthora megakarya]